MKRHYIFLSALIIPIVFLLGCANKTPQNRYAGKYTGTFSGASSGTWSAEIKNDGSVTAIMVDPDVGQFKLIGNVSSSGEFAGGGGVAQINRVSWNGQFEIDNGKCTCSGTWKSSTGPAGTWKGSRE